MLSINMAMTIDGKVTRPDGRWYGLTSKNDKLRMDLIRSKHDSMIVSKNSIINDDPNVYIRYVDQPAIHKIYLLIQNGIVTKNKKIFQSKTNSFPTIFCTETNYLELQKELSECANIESIGKTKIQVRKVVELIQERGGKKILLEGGPKLNYSFFNENLIDRIYLTIVPYLIGKKSLPNILSGDFELMDFDKNNWSLTEFEKIDNELFLIYDKINLL